MISPKNYHEERLLTVLSIGSNVSGYGVNHEAYTFTLCKYVPKTNEENPDCPEFIVRIVPKNLPDQAICEHSYYMSLGEYVEACDKNQLYGFKRKYFNQAIEEWRNS